MSKTQLEDVLLCPTLPSLPVVALQVIELTSDENVALKKIADIVQRDQALAGKVLKTVNSSFYGLSKPCASIDRAMAFLGMNTVKSLVLGFSLVDTSKAIEEMGFDLMAHWRHSILGATAAKHIATLTRQCDVDEAFTAGLFQDIGVLACFASMKKRYAGTVVEHPHDRWSKAERDAFGFSHVDVGAALAHKWRLPELVVKGIEGHENPDKLSGEERAMARTVALGSMIALALGEPRSKEAARTAASKFGAWFGKQIPDFVQLFKNVAEDGRTLAKLFQQKIGELQDPNQLLAVAQERSLEHQLSVQRRAENFEKDATTDGLTRLANRKQFDAAVEAAQLAHRESGQVCSIIFMDADRFKSVNDQHGHAAGDAVLVELARRVTETVGDQGLVCRYGGEEIAVVLPGMGRDGSAVLGEAIRAAIAATPFDLSGVEGAPDQLAVTVSVGVSATDGDEPGRYKDFKVLVADADGCVYDAKRAGRNRVFVHHKKDAAPERDEPAKPGTTTGGVRVLLIEDDPLAATLITSLLKRQPGVTVEWVESGTRARTELGQIDESGGGRFDVILSDLNLPGVSGFDLLRFVRSSKSMMALPFFVLSGENEGPSKEEAERLGATAYIAKQKFVQNAGHWLGVIQKAHGQNKAA